MRQSCRHAPADCWLVGYEPAPYAGRPVGLCDWLGNRTALTLRQRRKATLASSWVTRLSSLHQLMSSPCSSSTDLMKVVCVAADRWASARGSVKRATTFTINQLKFNYNVFSAFNDKINFLTTCSSPPDVLFVLSLAQKSKTFTAEQNQSLKTRSDSEELLRFRLWRGTKHLDVWSDRRRRPSAARRRAWCLVGGAQRWWDRWDEAEKKSERVEIGSSEPWSGISRFGTSVDPGTQNEARPVQNMKGLTVRSPLRDLQLFI